MKTYNDIYFTARSALNNCGIEAFNLEARLIVSHAAGKTSAELMRDLPLYASPEIEQRAFEYVTRRIAGEPVAYLLGAWEFYGLPIIVTPDVLIPRMDTELLVTTAKGILTGRNMNARVLDLCCGSGCIACAIGHEMPATKLVAVDISQSALEVCRQNISLNRLAARAICMQADALSAPPMALGQFDMIVSNPPYIKSAEISTLDSSVKDYEPLWALDGGEDGLKFYKAIIKNWRSSLKPHGALLFEVGEEQAQPVADMLSAASFHTIFTQKDTLGIDRVVVGIL